MITKIVNGKIILGERVLENYALYFEDEKIMGIFNPSAPAAPVADTVIDANGKYVSPGFVDIHTHGAGGSDFLDCEVEGYLTAAKMHAEHGTTALCPTTTSGEYRELLDTFSVYRKAKEINDCGADLLGLHLEGPYFAMSQKGAQDAKYVRDFDKEEYTNILKVADGDIIRWSAAPELPGAVEFAKTLTSQGILPSIGHSDADNFAVEPAFEAGFTHVTHLYSCTSTITRDHGFRRLGVIESAYLLDDIYVEIICDGKHLPPELIRLIYKIKGADRIALITDSLALAGTDQKHGFMQDTEFIIEDGVCKLMDRSAFAGSIATADMLVRVAVKEAGISIVDAIKMITQPPAEIIGLAQKGMLERGVDADIVFFDDDINIYKLFVQGNVI